MTDICENITFLQLRLRAVIMRIQNVIQYLKNSPCNHRKWDLDLPKFKDGSV